MARGRRRNRKKPTEEKDHLLREEQGDLLAEALGKVMGRGMVPGKARSEAGEGGGKSSENPGPEREGEEAVTGKMEEEMIREGKDGPMVETAEAGHRGSDRPAENLEPLEAPETSEAVDPPAAPEAIPDSPWEQKMAWAKERVREGRLDDALDLYRELVAEEPSSVRALNNLGILLDEMGEHAEAATCLERAQALDPQNLEVAGNLGAALGALGKYQAAEEQLRKVLRREPENVEVRANLGILFYRRGLYQTAEEELAAVCRAEPNHGLAFYYRGEALNRLGRVEEAIEALKRSIELSPKNPRAYYALGILFDRKNLPEEAAGMYRKSRDLSRR